MTRINSDGKLSQEPKVVAIGGGTGLSILLRGLKNLLQILQQ